jgi:hypothetical protein
MAEPQQTRARFAKSNAKLIKSILTTTAAWILDWEKKL